MPNSIRASVPQLLSLGAGRSAVMLSLAAAVNELAASRLIGMRVHGSLIAKQAAELLKVGLGRSPLSYWPICPASEAGCTIFGRIWQFRAGDQAQIVRRPGEGEEIDSRKGATAADVLFDDGHDKVWLEERAAGETMTLGNEWGLEFLVLSGEPAVGGQTLEAQGWTDCLPAWT